MPNDFMMETKIVHASKADAPYIGEVVVAALGEEIASTFAGADDVSKVVRLFTILAAREDSQYSYCNALKAVDETGNPMGFVIGYDGVQLHPLRKAMYEEARKLLGNDMAEIIGEETTPDEYYLDSLAVFPEYRGRGVASTLINAMYERSRLSGKPLGLLCEKSNVRARKLYDSLGFRKVGETPFANEMMDHLQKL